MTEATVEVLTAEVRSLMVGSRQITLSVARQLDTVPLGEVEVMGRIRLDRDPPKDCGHVIGRSRVTGALVISYYTMGGLYRFAADLLEEDMPKTDSRLIVCLGIGGSNRRMVWRGYPVQLDHGTFTHRLCAEIHPDDASRHIALPTEDQADALDRTVTRQREQWNERLRLTRAAMDAPLIVLAGLK